MNKNNINDIDFVEIHDEDNKDEAFQLTINDKIDDLLGDIKSELLKYVNNDNLDLLEHYNGNIFEQLIRNIVEYPFRAG